MGRLGKQFEGGRDNSRKKCIDGHKFESDLEACRYLQLKTLLLSGAIRELQLNVRFILTAYSTDLGHYDAHFVFFENKTDRYIVEDASDLDTALYKWKWKHLQAQYRGKYLFRRFPIDYNDEIIDERAKKEKNKRRVREFFRKREIAAGKAEPTPFDIKRAEDEKDNAG